MKNILKLLLFALIIVSGCKKDELDDPIDERKEPYIKSFIQPDTLNTYKGTYYIHIDFNNPQSSELKELTLSGKYPNWSGISETGLGMSGQGISFRDSKTNVSLEIYFHFNTNEDTTFNIRYADYYFSDPWNNVAGANINYLTPVNNTPTNSQYYLYLGTNTPASYFKITYIANNRINGVFSTLMKECCGGIKTYNVTGDFSVPNPRYIN